MLGGMINDELTLEELSKRTGIEPRTLRSWVSEGLLSPPIKPGRGARYPADNADRALAVRALKDLHGISLSEIGRHFLMATEDQIREWALEAGPTAALDYVKDVQSHGIAEEPPRPSKDYAPKKSHSRMSKRPYFEPRSGKSMMQSDRIPNSTEFQAQLASIERLILQLAKVLEDPPSRHPKGAIWTRISITPDLELSVRGDMAPQERVLFEQLAGQFRAILIRGIKND
jgi:DNA-binding transcriptional MerR regulator